MLVADGHQELVAGDGHNIGAHVHEGADGAVGEGAARVLGVHARHSHRAERAHRRLRRAEDSSGADGSEDDVATHGRRPLRHERALGRCEAQRRVLAEDGAARHARDAAVLVDDGHEVVAVARGVAALGRRCRMPAEGEAALHGRAHKRDARHRHRRVEVHLRRIGCERDGSQAVALGTREVREHGVPNVLHNNTGCHVSAARVHTTRQRQAHTTHQVRILDGGGQGVTLLPRQRAARHKATPYTVVHSGTARHRHRQQRDKTTVLGTYHMRIGVVSGEHGSKPVTPHVFARLVYCDVVMPTRRHARPKTLLQAAPATSPLAMARHTVDSLHVDIAVLPMMSELSTLP
jgi:hypothetical protein